jgi:D-3-phosphoglycerate dehydrogenase
VPNPLKILVAESSEFTPAALAVLDRIGDVHLADFDEQQLRAAITPYQILWVRLRNKIGKEILDAAPNLKAIATPTTGVNHLDLELLEERQIKVMSLRGETTFLNSVRATAELTLGLMLALTRHIPAACEATKDGAWNRDRFRGNELHGKTVGIVGYGRLGRHVANYCAALGLTVLVTDPNVRKDTVPLPFEMMERESLLRHSDLVSLHVSLDEANRGFFGSREFQTMREGSWFINTSRGELIDESALLQNLDSGHLAGAALDVLQDEQSGGFAARPLVQYAASHRNLLITPHIGGCTSESMAKTELFLAEKLLEVFGERRAGAKPVPSLASSGAVERK